MSIGTLTLIRLGRKFWRSFLESNNASELKKEAKAPFLVIAAFPLGAVVLAEAIGETIAIHCPVHRCLQKWACNHSRVRGDLICAAVNVG